MNDMSLMCGKICRMHCVTSSYWKHSFFGCSLSLSSHFSVMEMLSPICNGQKYPDTEIVAEKYNYLFPSIITKSHLAGSIAVDALC